eukprot:3838312-Rhodomonas_salina.4
MLDWRLQKGGTAFMCAAGGGHMQVMDLLLEKGANPNHLNKTRGSALLWASFAGNNAVVSKLVAIPGFQLNNANDVPSPRPLSSSLRPLILGLRA